MKRPSIQSNHGASRRDSRAQRRPSRGPGRDAPHRPRGDEPEPIRIPPGWEVSRKRSRRKVLRITAKVAMVVMSFGLLTLPFIINHLDQGAFYYQEVPVEIPDVPFVETPPTVDLPVAPVENSGEPAEPVVVPADPMPIPEPQEDVAWPVGDPEAGVDDVDAPEVPIEADAAAGAANAQ